MIIFRVFSDRLIDAADHEAFVTLLSDKLGTMFDLTFHNLCPNKQPPIFGKSTAVVAQFIKDMISFKEYQSVWKLDSCKTVGLLYERLTTIA